ncbi:MAG: PLP-dependent aspartate aminotransferase family protein [Pirellulales bacterium]|nr:PLP-dependent aspartate aminotransferase family protein [Pirellulales bacterium]
MSFDQQQGFSTKAIHVGSSPDPTTGATIPPVYLTSTYTQAAPGQHKGYEYSRSNNPTRQGLEDCLAALEGGAEAACFASGLQATTTIVQSLLASGQSIVAYGDMYGGTYRLFERVFKPWGLTVHYTDENSPEAFAKLVDETTRLVWLETPTNPMLRLLDIQAIGQAVKDRAARLGTSLSFAVDNTFASPVLQQPLSLGADIVVHSTTKYIGGHSDLIGGAVICKTSQQMEPIRFTQNAAGGVPGAFDCFLMHRGIKTLALRMEAHSKNAQCVAKWAAGQDKLERVIYPGLDSHPDYDLCTRQMASPGGMVSIVVPGGFDGATSFMSSTQVFSCAESLGGVESLCNHPAIMTHASIPLERREELGVVDGLVRLSVGVEDVDDLIADLDQALAAVPSAKTAAR